MDDSPEVTVKSFAPGRDLAWIEVGDRRGTPVIALHGSPGRGLDFAIHNDTALAAGVRLIAVDRSGYGHSTPHPGRTLSDWAKDIRDLSRHLELGRFGVIGHSAGGPHALACAYFLPQQVMCCGVLSGLAPQSEKPLTNDMLLSNRVQTALYRRWPVWMDWMGVGLWYLTKPIVSPLLSYGRRNAEREVDRTMPKMLPACDLEVVSRPEVRELLVAQVSRFDSATLRASVQDMAIGIRNWGFELKAIEVPVHIWHGDSDRNVPVAHAHQLEDSIPNATLHVCPGEGHWLLVDHMAEILKIVAAELR